MKRFSLGVLGLLAIGCGVAAWAQPPGGPERGGPERASLGRGAQGEDGPRGERRGAPEGSPRGGQPLIEALDANRDHVISAEEIQAAAAALRKLDKNGDGELSEDEFRPQGPPPPPPPPPRERGERGERGERAPSDARPRPEHSERDRDEPSREERPAGDDADRPGREGRAARGFGPPPFGPGGPAGNGGPGGPPNPERFVEHAMEFDANGDEMLDKSELLKFAQGMGRRRGGPDGTPQGGPGMRRPGGPRDGDRPDNGSDRPRPERPERSEQES